MKTILAFLFIFGAVPALATDFEQETLFSGDIEHGAFGGPSIKVLSVKDEPGVLVGGYGGWLINHSLMLGGGAFGLVNNILASNDVPLINSKRPSTAFGYGGPMIEYTGNPKELVHYTAHMLIGGGVAGYYLRDHHDWDEGPDLDFHNDNWDICLAMEFGAGVELNVASFFRINAGVSYLFVNGIELPGLADGDINGPSAHLTLKFGKF